jgi:sialidase-1
MTVRLSYDDCRTWPISRVLHRGPAAYSDLCVGLDGTICCFYERGGGRRDGQGDGGPYERLTLARFNLEWLTRGIDRG